MSCKHETTLDSVDVKRRPIRTCSGCGHRMVCLTCNDTHKMTLGDQVVACTACPVPCKECRFRGVGAYCAKTPCMCKCHDRDWYGYWNGMCPARKHGLDWKGQRCDLCAYEGSRR